jgi:hypothetical protein
MSESELREALSTAGTRFDGHVTHGSLDAQMALILAEFARRAQVTNEMLFENQRNQETK